MKQSKPSMREQIEELKSENAHLRHLIEELQIELITERATTRELKALQHWVPVAGRGRINAH